MERQEATNHLDTAIMPRIMARKARFISAAAIVVALIAASVAWLINDARRQMRSRMLATISEVGTFREFPDCNCSSPEGNVLYSWRFRVYVVAFQSIHSQLDKAWDSDQNMRVANVCPPIFCEQADSRTRIMAICGAGTAFDEKPAKEELPGDTLLLVEVCGDTPHWMEPGDLAVDDLEKGVIGGPWRLGGDYVGGTHLGFLDGQVWYVGP